jgi:ectoine hydrolase
LRLELRSSSAAHFICLEQKLPKAFHKSEFDARLVRIKQSMTAAGIDLMFVASPANIDYVTGYNVKSYSNLQLVIIDLNDEQPHWIGRYMDAGGALMLTNLDEAHVHHYRDHYVESAERHPFDRVVDIARERGWHNKRIGVEKSAYFFTAKSLEVLVAGLPDARFVDASGLVNWVRVVKSPAEVVYMKQAGVLTDLGMKAGFEMVEPGRRQSDAAAAVYHAMIAGTQEFGGFPTAQPMMPTGEEFSKTYHTSWSDHPYLANTSTGFEFTGSRYMYSAPLARTIYLGRPPQNFLDKAAIMIEGLEALVDGLKAGMTGEEGEMVWREVAIKRGVDKEARIGYSVGLCYPPTWGEQTVSLRPGDKTVLQENMAIHLIPSLMGEGWGLEISETVIIGSNRSEPLSSLPRDVVVKN